MPNYDYFNQIKDELLILNLNSISRVFDILNIYKNYSVGFDNINLSESYEKIRKVNLLNLSSLRELLNYINYLEDTSSVFSVDDLLEMVDNLYLAYKSQDKFVLDIINYILIEEGIITEKHEVTSKLNDYLESDSNSYDFVMVINKKIKRKIKKERRDNLEQD